MKTRYKISVVILATVIFYFGLQTLGLGCRTFIENCLVFHEMAYYSSIILPRGDGTWIGSSQGLPEPQLFDYLQYNRMFILSYMIIPGLIIVAIIFKYKRKIK